MVGQQQTLITDEPVKPQQTLNIISQSNPPLSPPSAPIRGPPMAPPPQAPPVATPRPVNITQRSKTEEPKPKPTATVKLTIAQALEKKFRKKLKDET